MGSGNSKDNHRRAAVEDLLERVRGLPGIDSLSLEDKSKDGGVDDIKIKLLVTLIAKNDPLQLFKLVDDGIIGVNERYGKGLMTPLHFAILLECLPIIRALLGHPSIDVNLGDVDGDSPLLYVTRSGKSDIKTLGIIGILVADPSCQLGKENDQGHFALAACAAKGFKESTKFLILNERLQMYTARQLLIAIRYAMASGYEIIADMILEASGDVLKLAIAVEVAGEPGLAQCLQVLQDVSPGRTGETRPSSSTEKTETVGHDSNGTEVRLGDFVTLLNSSALRKLIPTVKEEIVAEIANKQAVIYEIRSGQGSQNLLLDVVNTPHLRVCPSTAVIFFKSRKLQALADGTNAWVGSHVRVSPEVDVVKELSKGHGGWLEAMAECCGKTGQVFNIDSDGDIQVVFGWGQKFYFNPMVLLSSTAKKTEAKDSNGNFICGGSSVIVTSDAEEFKKIQLDQRLAADEDDEMKVVGRRVSVELVRIRYKYVSVIVISAKERFALAASNVISLLKAKDSAGNEFEVGDQVQVVENLQMFKQLQTPEFGGWSDKMAILVCEPGTVLKLDVNRTLDATDVVVNVKFEKGTFYLNPKALVISQSAKDSEHTQFHIGEDEMTVISRQELWVGDELGEGAFGCVVKGTWNDSPCAIKQIKSIVLTKTDREDIIKEAKIQYSLKHPNIVQLFGISFERDLWMVMRYIDGTQLYKKTFPKVSGEKPLPFEVKIKVARQACNAIAYIHDKGYTHSDIKPHNMIVENQTGYLYLCDFGISRYLGPVSVVEFSTMHTNTFAGTVYYMAPECHQTDEMTGRHFRPTFAADVWSTAIVFAELFTEEKIYPTDQSLLQLMIGNVDVTRPLIAKMDPIIKPIFEKTLVKDFSKRPSAQEMKQFFLAIPTNKK